MNTPLKLGEKVSIVREMKKIPQTWLAMQLNISQQAYQKLEQGKTILTNDRLIDIASILEVEEQMIRDIDKHPIITYSSQKNINQEYSVYKKNSELDKEYLTDTNRIEFLVEEIKNLKLVIESLVNIIEKEHKKCDFG
jgi:transcriptional regulator with XRE-family HTH domain